ncbi:MAG: tetratricopeptide repeat protein [Saprospiraceae bacterium]|nr:tetratricopeptide repeat protein [Saprospiraceae bacterium]
MHYRQNQLNEAQRYLEQGLRLCVEKGHYEPSLATNLAVVAARQNQYQQARQTLLEAVNQTNDESLARAYLYNGLAAHHYFFEEYAEAETYAKQALRIGQANKDWAVQLDSYRLLAQITRQTKNYAQSQAWQQAIQVAQDSLASKKNTTNSSQRELTFELDKRERDAQLALIDRDNQRMQLKQLQLEADKKEQELQIQRQQDDLLRQELALRDAALKNQQLEKERIEQQLRLQAQKAQADKQKQAITILEKNKELQALKIKQQEEEKINRQREIALQKQQLENQTQALENETQRKRFINVVLILVSVFLAFAIAALIYLRRTNLRLDAQKNQIDQQRLEISEQNQELQQTTQALETQNRLLETRDRQISSSIMAALTIQQAILPPPSKMNALLPPHFVLYRPKDVVSGDFYWLNQVADKTILVAADCTGHGVPGAFMTMIGNTLLDKIVRLRQVIAPADILSRLHEEIYTVLSQGETASNMVWIWPSSSFNIVDKTSSCNLPEPKIIFITVYQTKRSCKPF